MEENDGEGLESALLGNMRAKYHPELATIVTRDVMAQRLLMIEGMLKRVEAAELLIGSTKENDD